MSEIIDESKIRYIENGEPHDQSVYNRPTRDLLKEVNAGLANKWKTISSNYEIRSSESLLVDAVSPITIQLPTNVDQGHWARVVDGYGKFGTHPVTIDGNGIKILQHGTEYDSIICDDGFTTLEIIYSDGKWVAVTFNPSENSSTLDIPSIAFIGDSNTIFNLRGENWASIVVDKIETLVDGPIRVYNSAVAGNTFSEAVSVKTHDNGTKTCLEKVAEFVPDLVFISVGYNDQLNKSFSVEDSKASADTIKDTLREVNPDVKFIYIDAVPLNTSVSIQNLTNDDVISLLHQTVTINGVSGCRTNSSSYLSTAISNANKSKIEQNRELTSYSKNLFDNFVDVDFLAIQKAGAFLDHNHPSKFGQHLYAFYVLNAISKMNITFKGISLRELDRTDNTTVGSSPTALLDSNSPSVKQSFAGSVEVNSFNYSDQWMLTRKRLSASCPTRIQNVASPIVLTASGAFQSDQISVRHSSNVTSLESADSNGNSSVCFIPQYVGIQTTGDKSVQLFIGTGEVDVIQLQYNITSSLPQAAAVSRFIAWRSSTLTRSTGDSLTLKIPFNMQIAEGDVPLSSISVGTFTVPASLNGRVAVFSYGIRSTPNSVYTSQTAVNSYILKNSQLPSGNSISTGMGLPSCTNVHVTNFNGVTYNHAATSAPVVLSTGDRYEVCYALTGSQASATILNHNTTFFSMHLLG